MRKYGYLASLDFGSWEAARVVETLAEMGYHSVEWPLGRIHPQEKGLDAIAEIKKITEAGGLVISEIVVQQDLVTPNRELWQQRVDLLKACIEAAYRAGGAILNTFTGPAPWDPKAARIPRDLSEGQAWDLVFRAFDELVPLAEERSVILAIEAVFGHLVHDYYTLCELLSRYDSPALAVNMDPSHLHLYRNDVPWVIRRLGRRIVHVHLKDAVGRPGMPGEDFQFTLLGEGMIDWSAFASALDEIGYDGCWSVEFEAFRYYRQVLKSDPVAAARLSMQQIRSLFS